jgi:hypothetical protein
MKRLLPPPIALTIATILLAVAAVAYALLNPEVRLWLQNTPPNLNATVGAFAGTVLGLLGIAAAIIYHAGSEREGRAARETENSRVLAAAFYGELIALSQWLMAQITMPENPGQNAPYRSNEFNGESDQSGFMSRTVYEANANRLHLLGPDLAAAIAYCHTVFEQAEWEHSTTASGAMEREERLKAVETKIRLTSEHLAAFISGASGRINPRARAVLFSAPTGQIKR